MKTLRIIISRPDKFKAGNFPFTICYQVFLGDSLIGIVPVTDLTGFLSCIFKDNPGIKVSLSEYVSE